jgi:hypothetical protein
LQYIAALTGASTETLTTMMARFGAALPEAEKGTGRVAAGLKALGLSAKELIGLNFDERLNKIAEAVSGFVDSQQKLDAVSALGRGFKELIPTLDEGVEGLDKLRAGAHAAGVALDPEMTERLVSMQHGMVDAKEAVIGATVQGFNPFIGVVNGATAILKDFSQQFAESAKQGGVMYVILGSIAEVIKHVEQGIGETSLFLKDLWADGTLAFKATSDGAVGFGHVMDDVSVAINESFAKFWKDLLAAGTSTFLNIGAAAENMAVGIKFALEGDLGSAKQAFAGIATNATDAAAAIGKAFGTHPLDWSKAESDLRATGDKLKQDLAERNKTIADANTAAQTEYNRIWGISTGGEEGKKPTAQVPNLQASGGKTDKTSNEQALAGYAEDLEAFKANATAQEQVLAEELKTHQVTMAQWLAQTKDVLEDERQDVTATYAAEMADATITTAEKIKLKKEEQKQLDAISKQEAAAEIKAAEDSVKAWMSVGDSIAGILNSQVNSLLRGTESISKAFANMAASVIEDLIKMGVKILAEATAMEALSLATGGALGGFGAGGFGSWLGSMLHFDEGTEYVQQTGPAIIHQGEMVVPADQNPNNPANRLGDGGGDTFHAHNNIGGIHINTGGGAADPATIARAVNKAFSNGDHFGLKNLRGSGRR